MWNYVIQNRLGFSQSHILGKKTIDVRTMCSIPERPGMREREHLEASKLRQRCRAAVCASATDRHSRAQSHFFVCGRGGYIGKKNPKTLMYRKLATVGRLQTPTSCSYDVMQQQQQQQVPKRLLSVPAVLSEMDCILK